MNIFVFCWLFNYLLLYYFTMKALIKQIQKKFSTKINVKYDIKHQNKDIILQPKAAKHKSTLIWLHGLGDSANGYLDLFLSEQSPTNKDMKVILMTAPESPVSINYGTLMNSWYDINFDNIIPEKEVEVSSKRIYEYYKNEHEIIGIKEKNIFIGGFSQGSAMSLYFALNCNTNLGGVICMSGYAFKFLNLEENKTKQPHILTFHGNIDPVIPEKNARQSYEKVKKDNPNFIYKTFDIEHTICIEELNLMKDFMNKRL